MKNIAVIGTGVIGTGWILRFLANGIRVKAFDKNSQQLHFLKEEITRTNLIIKKLYNTKINFKNLEIVDSIEEAVKNADLIQENVPERLTLKKDVIKNISKYSPSNSIIASSSSGLLPSDLQSKCINPKRLIIAHPFNPVYILPLVEIVKGKKTTNLYLNKAKKFYQKIKMKTLSVEKELPGFLSDRLQEALWREGLHIINEGHATTEDLDRAIEDGPGLRWSLMGTFLTFHLAGGKAGMRHMLEQFGPALKLPWTKLKAPRLSNKLIDRLVKGTKKQSKGKSVSKISNIRDEYLVELQKLRKKYEKKLR